MKKRITMIFVTLLAAGLCACGSSGQKKAAPEDAGIETKEAGKGSEETAETNGLVVSWPEKNVQISVPYKAGGGVDKAARLVCSELEKSTGKTFVITNKPEGNGIIAINELMGQAPDGYNLMVVSNRDLFGHIVNQIEGVEYGKDSFTYIATLLEGADSLFAQNGKYDSFDGMIEYAKSNPGKLTIATSNNTGLDTLNQICEKLGIEISGVAYSSGADAFADLLGGHVDGALVALSFYAQGKENGVTPILTMTDKQFPVDDLKVECLTDYGVEEAASPMSRFLIGPAGMDQALVDAIVAQMDIVYADGSSLNASIMSQYDNPEYLTGDELKAFVDGNFQMRQEQAAVQ